MADTTSPRRPLESSLIHHLRIFLVPLAIGMAVTASRLATADEPPGLETYRSLCAECHGAQGEGVEDRYADPLHGDRSLDDLTQIIDETMPEEEPERCTGEKARQVAEYLYQTFYTAEARARHQPPRIELSRLTVRQYRNAVADLLATFWGDARPEDQRGIQGRYFRKRNFRRNEQALERVDPRIDFDFQADSPDPEQLKSEEFSIRWEGGLIVQDSGDYEFLLVTENGARLWVNDPQKPLIDAWVKSGDATEHRATCRLLGGRVYPLRLDHFKFKDKTASVSLQWQPPHGARQVVPQRNLVTGRYPRVMVVETEFPADDSSLGYPRGTSVSPSWDQATTYAAVEIAGKVVDQLESLSGIKPDAPDRERRLREFAHRFAERAFRRPLTAEQRQFFVDDLFDRADDPDAAIKRVILLVLKSPRFLYLGLGGEPVDGYQVAERMSFGLWDSLPDRDLLKAAADQRVQTKDEVVLQARRMLSDLRTRAKLRDSLHQWLKVDRSDEISKDEQAFPGFDPEMASDLRTSLDLFLEDVVWGEQPDFRQLLLSDRLFVNERLSGFYGIETELEQPFQMVSLDRDRCAGVLTHPYLMANLAYHKSTSPIHRGVFVVRSLLGRSLKPPPMAVTPLDESFDPDMTTRQRVAFQTRPAACQTCHELINPFGFSLEHYDAVGRFRAAEKLKPIDAKGSYKTVAGDVVLFDGARDLAEFLAGSDETHRWFVEQLFHQIVKQPVAAYGPRQLEQLTQSFAKSEFNIQQLLIEIMAATALTGLD